MRNFSAAVVVLLLGAGWADAQGTTGRVYYRSYYCPTYAVTSVPVYYSPVVCAPAVVLAPARPVVVVPNLAIPTAAPPSQTKEPPLAPGKTDKAPGSKTERPPQTGDSFYLNVSRPPVVTGAGRMDGDRR